MADFDVSGRPEAQDTGDVGPREMDLTGMPEEFKSRPKLKYLWLSGQGKLSSKQQKMMDKAMNDGKMKLSNEDWITLESYMPQSMVKDFDRDKTKALTMAKAGPDDLYLQGLIADAYRKQEVDRVMEGLRTTSIGLGATFGSLLGSSVGPLGTIAGGAGGAAAGSSFIDGVENTTKMILDRMFPEQAGTHQTFTTQEIARRAMTEGLIDLGAGGVGVYAPMIAKKLKQKMLGMTAASEATADAAARMGVDMLPLQVGRPILGAYTNVMARVPFIGGPIRKRIVAQNAQVASFTDSLPGRISAKKWTDQDVGVFLDIKAQEGFEKDMAGLTARQIKINMLANKAGPVVPMTEASAVAQKWLDHYGSSDFVSTDKHVIAKLQKLVNLSKTGKITLGKWDADLMAGLRDSIDKLDGGEGTKAVIEVMEAARLDLSGAGKVGLLQLGMDKAWEAGLRKYESVAAKKFMLVDKARFRQGVMRLGTRNPDELVGLLMGGESPAFVHQVRGIVGDEAMADLASKYMERQLKSSSTVGKGGIVQTDWDGLERKLGLDNLNGGKYGVTKEMVRLTGVTPQMLQEFIKVGKAASKIDIPDASTFLSRRVAIAGATAGLGILAGILGPQSMGVGIGLTLVARQGSKIISNPENIRLATLALDANTDQALRRSSLVRLYRLLGTEQEGPTGGEGDVDGGEPSRIGVHRGPPMPQEFSSQ